MSVKIVVTTHPYEAQREDEISFEKDEVIKVTDFSDPDWWVGKKKDSSLGFFPSNFVIERDEADVEKPKEEAVATAQNEETVEEKEVAEGEVEKEGAEEEEASAEPVEEKKVDQVIGMARVMEDYAMSEPGEISLHRGGIINVYEVIDSEWSRGELNGKVGKYPSKYVEDIDMPGRPDLGKQPSSSSDVQQRSTSGDDEAPKGGFKLAAFGVKQGGIGSLFAGGGFPGLKKTGGAGAVNKPKEVVVEQPKAEPVVPTESKPIIVPAATFETKEEEEKEEENPVAPIVESPSTPEQPKPAAAAPAAEKPKSLGKAIVLHPYDAESEDELSLLRGEYVEILDRNADEGWWKGLNERGQSGVFPSSFVRELEEEIVAPPTPTRTRRSVQSPSSPATAGASAVPPPVPSGSRPSSTMAKPPQVPRPSSVQTPTTARPISVQAPAQRPSSISHTTSGTTAMATPPKLFPTPIPTTASPPIAEEPNQEDIKEEEEEQEQQEEKVAVPVESVEKVQSPPPAAPIAVERNPASFSEDSVKSPISERKTSLLSEEESVKSPEVIEEDPITDEEEKESGVEEIISNPVAVPAKELEKEETKVEPVVEEKKAEEKIEEEQKEEKKEEVDEEDEFADAEETTTPAAATTTESDAAPADSAIATTAAEEEKPIVPEASIEEPAKTEETIEEKKGSDQEPIAAVVAQEEDKNEFDIIPTGPKLTTPARARIGGGRARRSPQAAVSQEPSQTELLQKELLEEQAKEKEETSVTTEEGGNEEKKSAAPSPPAKPVKPIFAKFPTPFAAGADAISKTQLKPTQTRRLWEDKPAESAPTHNTTNITSTEEEPQPVRPSGVKNIASRFNFAGPAGGGGSNEVLETKLKNHTKNEVEKVKKEFEQLLNEEREKRLALESTVQELSERLKVLEGQQ